MASLPSVTVVSDTSPISYLVLTRTEEAIPELYGEVLVPEAVHRELVHPNGPDVVRERISDSPAGIKEETVGSGNGERSRGKEEPGDLQDLDPGEREAIRLSVQEEAGLLLIDERAGRTVARMYGIKVTGTIGVLGAATQKGLIDPGRAVRDLRQTSFRASADLYRWLLDKQQ
jgi:predicted nucleic acid-binding protein